MDEAVNPEVAVAAGGEVAGGEPQTLGWRSELPTAMREHDAFKAYQTKNDLWNGHIEAVTKVRDLEGKLTSYIPKLADDANDEAKAAYRAAMGIPDSVDGYEVDLPDGDDGSLANWFKSQALDLGMPKEMAKGLSARWNTFIENVAKAETQRIQQDYDESLAAVRKEWGPEADAMAEKVKAGYKVFADSKPLNDLLNAEIEMGGKKVKVGNHPGMVNLILEIGKKITPDRGIQGDPPSESQQPQNGVIAYDWGKQGG